MLVPVVVAVVGIAAVASGSTIAVAIGVLLIIAAVAGFFGLAMVFTAIGSYARALIYRYSTGRPVPGIDPALFAGVFTVTSHLIVTVALALMVFITVVVYGFWKNGLRFLKLFVPSGVPIYILPLVVLLEVFSFLIRPVSHSVRLFANMLAGHITLKVFASFVTMLGGFGLVGWVGAVLPLGLTVALTALELLVAFLQAYVFAILTCIYLNDAIHPGH